ncbi:TPA: YcbK family protein [Burkholderia vietnamiensis]|nr:YcbK family protein [Burkholderia vietnamiensis]
MNRRDFLKAGACLGAISAGGMMLPADVSAQALGPDLGLNLMQGPRTLNLVRPESGERFNFQYLQDGKWLDNAYPDLCWLLRDIHVNECVQIDYNLIGILDWTQWYLRQYGYNQPLEILSGYRSKYTNDRTEGAKKDSQHLYGKAIDLRVPGLSTEYLGRLFLWLSRGGVGVYPGKKFVHIDTGRVRTWRG